MSNIETTLDQDQDADAREAALRAAAPSVTEQIQAHVTAARKSLRAAMRLSEESGIPFRSNPSMVGQRYVPSTYHEMFSGIDPDIMEEVTGVYVSEYSEIDGWEHSMVC